MADQTNDLLMKLVTGGAGVPAECGTQIENIKGVADRDPFLEGFREGHFFEIDDFQFGCNLSDQDNAGDIGGSKAAGHGAGAAGAAAATASTGPRAPFQSWKSAKPDANTADKYPFQVDEFSFTRYIDKASPTLFDYCANKKSFVSAALVKRKITGSARLEGFLRFDFFNVLITSLEWQDGEIVKETCKFVFREMKLRYAQQLASGRLQDAKLVQGIEPVSWSWQSELVKRQGQDSGRG